MRTHEKKISKEVYDRAIANNGHITSEDELTVFNEIERWGYGVYRTNVIERDGEYFVRYELGDSCD